MPCSVSPTWDSLVVAYLSGSGDFTALYEAAKRPMERMVARIAPHLPEDIREEAVDEVFVRLLQNPPKYRPGKCSVKTLVFGLLRNAVRHVLALYAAPGQKTRFSPEKTSAGESIEAVKDAEIELESDSQELDETSTVLAVKEIASTRWTASGIEAYAEASELLSGLPVSVATAAWMVHIEGETLNDTANAMGMSRFAVWRAFSNMAKGARLPHIGRRERIVAA
jgi:DNA-directed RNA polymerase specialized sigma24 family protein